MKRKISKTYSIDADLFEKFEKLTRILYTNNSTFIQESIKKYVEDNKILLENIEKIKNNKNNE